MANNQELLFQVDKISPDFVKGILLSYLCIIDNQLTDMILTCIVTIAPFPKWTLMLVIVYLYLCSQTSEIYVIPERILSLPLPSHRFFPHSLVFHSR